MITMELTGNERNRGAGGGYLTRPQYEVLVDGKSHYFATPICEAARMLLSEGADPDEEVIVTRNGKIVFHPYPLGAWAKRSVSETDRHSAKWTTYTPFPSEKKPN